MHFGFALCSGPLVGRMILMTAIPLSIFWGQTVAQQPRSATSASGSGANDAQQAAYSINWSDRELRAGLASLAATENRPIFLDRRVDPGQVVTFRSEQVPFTRLIGLVAQHLRLASAELQDVVYLGPAPNTSSLPALVSLKQAEVVQVSPELARKFAARKPRSWPRLSTPRSLLTQWSSEESIAISNLEAIPHDLWDATELTPLNQVEYLSLILFGFGKTFEILSDDSLRIVELDMQAKARHRYEARISTDELTRLRSDHPALKLQRTSSGLQAEGPLAAHGELARYLQRLTVSTAVRGTTTYTLTLSEQPVGGVLQALARETGLTLRISPQISSDQLSQRISISVQQASLEDLLTAILKSTPLRFDLQGKQLDILPK